MTEQILELLFHNYPELQGLPVTDAYRVLYDSIAAGGTVFACGNGGSAADAEHIVSELMKGFLSARPLSKTKKAALKAYGEAGTYLADHLQQGISAFALSSHTALLTAVANDTSYEVVFAQQLYSTVRAGDVLIAMSTTGNSRNVILAAVAATVKGASVIGITGEAGGTLAGYCDVCLRLPSQETYRVQEYTLPLYHAICAMLEQAFFA